MSLLRSKQRFSAHPRPSLSLYSGIRRNSTSCDSAPPAGCTSPVLGSSKLTNKTFVETFSETRPSKIRGDPRAMWKLNNIWIGVTFGLVALTSFPQPTNSTAQPATAAPQTERFAALEKSLSGTTLVGHFVVTGEKETELNQERYELQSVRHVDGDQWLFSARIKYGDHDVTLPLTLPVRWAGDTPVISVDKMMFPGLGTYTARVMIYAGHYSGFWSGGDHGGHLFGVVKRLPTP